MMISTQNNEEPFCYDDYVMIAYVLKLEKIKGQMGGFEYVDERICQNEVIHDSWRKIGLFH